MTSVDRERHHGGLQVLDPTPIPARPKSQKESIVNLLNVSEHWSSFVARNAKWLGAKLQVQFMEVWKADTATYLIAWMWKQLTVLEIDVGMGETTVTIDEGLVVDGESRVSAC